jgi:hypothetical protein
MKSNSVGKYAVFAAFGLALLIEGLALIKLLPDPQGVMLTLPYLCVGIGAGIFGGNLGTAIQNHRLNRDPKAAKQVAIDTKDERNVAISNRAKAKAYDLMLMVYGALILAFALMQVEMYVILVFVAAYWFVVGSMVFYTSKYDKEM